MTAFDLRITRFQNMVGGVHDARTNVAQLLESKQVGRVLCIFKNKGSGPVNRNSPWGTLSQATCHGWVRIAAAVEGNCVKAGSRFVGHVSSVEENK